VPDLYRRKAELMEAELGDELVALDATRGGGLGRAKATQVPYGIAIAAGALGVIALH
jgi:hypothetical protein